MRLDRAWIERHIPHRGAMCLLDEVVDWDAERITCRSTSHRAADNPLRAHGRLGIACGIEYAAQAMAVHGALSGGAAAAQSAGSVTARAAAAAGAGMLAGVRAVEFHVLHLDEVAGDLLCSARRVAGDGRTALYDFELACEGSCLIRGRATVILGAGHGMMP
jgi:predicted hotdog family 3-hydroxylacyl-ACP dehydratase